MRLFVACHLPGDIRDSLARVKMLLGNAPDLRWVVPENLHVTLKFLGEAPSSALGPLEKELSEVSRQIEAFRLQVCGVGGFPSLVSARVVWAGLAHGKEQISQVSMRVESALVQLGFETERRGFSPHVTLARAKYGPVRGLDSALHDLRQRAFGEYQVSEFCLVESLLSPSGPQYRTLFRFGFGKDAKSRIP